jgi:hypothetical protein
VVHRREVYDAINRTIAPSATETAIAAPAAT